MSIYEPPNTVTGCEWEGNIIGEEICSIRQQSLRYQAVPSSTYPEIPSSNFLTIDKLTAELSFEQNHASERGGLFDSEDKRG